MQSSAHCHSSVCQLIAQENLEEATENEDKKPSVESCTNVGEVSLSLESEGSETNDHGSGEEESRKQNPGVPLHQLLHPGGEEADSPDHGGDGQLHSQQPVHLPHEAKPDVLAGPSHVVVVAEVLLQPGLHPALVGLLPLHVHHQGDRGGVRCLHCSHLYLLFLFKYLLL